MTGGFPRAFCNQAPRQTGTGIDSLGFLSSWTSSHHCRPRGGAWRRGHTQHVARGGGALSRPGRKLGGVHRLHTPFSASPHPGLTPPSPPRPHPTHGRMLHPKFMLESLSSGGSCKMMKHRNPQSGTKSQNPPGSGRQASPPKKRLCGAGPGRQLVRMGQGPAPLWSTHPPHSGVLAARSPRDTRGPAPRSSALTNVGNTSIW